MMKTSCSVLLMIIVASAVLTGCGQKGPLFLPGEEPASQTDGPFGIGTSDDRNQSSRPAPQSIGPAGKQDTR